MTPYAFIMCCDVRYLPEAIALLNSLDYIGNKQDLHWYGYQIPIEVLSQLDILSYQVYFHLITEHEVQESHGLSEVVCRKRYYYANEIGKDYESVCVLDADMVFVRDPINFFKIAAKTDLVVCAVKEQKESYGDPNHRAKGQWIMPEGFRPEMDLCNCPLFINTHVWGKALKKSFEIFMDGFPAENFKGPDMAAMNLCLLEAGSEGLTIGLPNSQWLATNEQAEKPYMRYVGDGDSIKTESGTPVYSFHGHIGHKAWRENQLLNRHNCIQGYLKASGESLEASDNIAKGSMELIYERFKKMLHYKIRLEPFNYRHPEIDYKIQYGNLWD